MPAAPRVAALAHPRSFAPTASTVGRGASWVTAVGEMANMAVPFPIHRHPPASTGPDEPGRPLLHFALGTETRGAAQVGISVSSRKGTLGFGAQGPTQEWMVALSALDARPRFFLHYRPPGVDLDENPWVPFVRQERQLGHCGRRDGKHGGRRLWSTQRATWYHAKGGHGKTARWLFWWASSLWPWYSLRSE